MVKNKDFVVVLGGANVDIVGRATGSLQRYDSNIGTVHLARGGVGRNIAENLARRGVDTEMICPLGEDSYGDFLQNHFIEHLSFQYAHKIKGGRTGVYVVLLDADGEMDTAMNDMGIMEHLTPDILEERRSILEKAKVWVMDTNLPEKSIRWILTEANKPVIVDGVSAPKAVKLKGLLKKIHTLKCNQYEAEALIGIRPQSKEDIIKCGEALRTEGVQHVVLTLGSKGAYTFNDTGCYHIYGDPVEVVNATGAGDAFVAALVYGVYKELDFLETVVHATAYSRLTLKTEASVMDQLNPIQLEREKKEIKYERI